MLIFNVNIRTRSDFNSSAFYFHNLFIILIMWGIILLLL